MLVSQPLPSAPSTDLFASGATTNILFFGDSLTAGYGLDPSQAYPARIQEKIEARSYPARVIVGAVSGDTSAGGVRRINWMLRQPIDILVLALGANDGLRGQDPEAMRANLQTIIDRTKEAYPEVTVIIAGMTMPANLGRDYVEAYTRVFPELAEANDAVLIPFLLEGVGARPELNLPDQIHPNEKGQKILANTVWTYLEPVLQATAVQ